MATAAAARRCSNRAFSQVVLTCDTWRSSPIGIPDRRPVAFFCCWGWPLSCSSSHSSYGLPNSGNLPTFSAAYTQTKQDKTKQLIRKVVALKLPTTLLITSLPKLKRHFVTRGISCIESKSSTSKSSSSDRPKVRHESRNCWMLFCFVRLLSPPLKDLATSPAGAKVWISLYVWEDKCSEYVTTHTYIFSKYIKLYYNTIYWM